VCLGIPGKVERIRQGVLPMADVVFGGITKEVCLAYVPEAEVGDYVVVHVGFAIARIDEAEAARVLSYLDEIGDLGALHADGSSPGGGDEA
jgi:hydrogenase expression/formation protein HypC